MARGRGRTLGAALNRPALTAAGVGIALGFMVLLILAALLDVLDDKLVAVGVSLCAMGIAALGTISWSGRCREGEEAG